MPHSIILTKAERSELEIYANQIAAAVEEELDHVLPPLDDADESRLFEAMRYSVFAGGKRMRPLLIMAANDILKGKKKPALRVAAAMECMHTYSLIHDDLPCMDDDDLRRGKPTCHIQFDEYTATLAGDALQALAFEILSDRETHPDSTVRVALVNTLAKGAGAYGMVGGQMIDMMHEHHPERTPDQGTLARLQRKKTGALFAACCEAAVLLNGCKPDEKARLVTYARNIGLAFQMVDDILDVTGDEKVVGKRVGKDAKKHKMTFVGLLGVDGTRQQAALLCQQAIDQLRPFKEGAHPLILLAKFVVSRAH